MTEPVNPRDLVGGVASSTLSAEERELLFNAALEDQGLFDELLAEEGLREVLSDDVARARLVAALTEDENRFARRWIWPFEFSRRTRAMLIVGVGALFVGVAAAIIAMRSATEPPSGTLVIDAVPWGTVAAIENVRGASMALPAAASTPFSLVVPSGTYEVTVTSPPPESQTQRITVRVDPNGSSVAPLVRFQAITPEDYFEPYLTAQAPPAEPALASDTAAAPAGPAPAQPAAAQSPAPAAGANP